MYRFRRLRRDERIRSMMQETRLHPKNFIYPVFVTEGEKIKNPVASMPGVFQYSVDRLDEILEQVKEAAVQMVSEGLPHPTQFEVDTALSFLFFLDKVIEME